MAPQSAEKVAYERMAALPVMSPCSRARRAVRHRGGSYCAIVAVSSLCVVAGRIEVLPASDGSGEVMSADDAKKLPIVGSCVLFSAFLAFKFLSKSLPGYR